MESPRPRVTATSFGVNRRGGSGRRAALPISAGLSDEKVTSRSGFAAIARIVPVMAERKASWRTSPGESVPRTQRRRPMRAATKILLGGNLCVLFCAAS